MLRVQGFQETAIEDVGLVPAQKEKHDVLYWMERKYKRIGRTLHDSSRSIWVVRCEDGSLGTRYDGIEELFKSGGDRRLMCQSAKS